MRRNSFLQAMLLLARLERTIRSSPRCSDCCKFVTIKIFISAVCAWLYSKDSALVAAALHSHRYITDRFDEYPVVIVYRKALLTLLYQISPWQGHRFGGWGLFQAETAARKQTGSIGEPWSSNYDYPDWTRVLAKGIRYFVSRETWEAPIRACRKEEGERAPDSYLEWREVAFYQDFSQSSHA